MIIGNTLSKKAIRSPTRANNQLSFPVAVKNTITINIIITPVFCIILDMIAGDVFKNLRRIKNARMINAKTKNILINESSLN